jgi:transposase
MGGWERRDDVATVWALQGFRVAWVEVREQDDKYVKVVGLEDRRGSHLCPCGKRHGDWVCQELEPRRWRDCSLGDFETYVELIPYRVACCEGTRVEVFPWEAPGHRMTRRFFERVAALCTRLPVLTVAEMVGLSWDTVCRVDKTATKMALGGDAPAFDAVRFIGVDEVSRTGGHQYFTIVTDLESGRVIWVAEGKREAALGAFFEKLGKRGCRRIRIVVSDLGGSYLAAIAKYARHARHVLDRFHIVKWLNDALSELRRRLFGGAPRDELGRELKVKKWLLLRAYEALELRHKRLLSRLVRSNAPLYRAYLLKEQLRGILHHPWRYLGALLRNLTDWCHAAVCSRIPEMAAVGRRLRPHLDKVVAGFGSGVKLGLVEATNGKIDLLRRQARGFRDIEYFKLKIFQRCSLPDNPWSDVAL